MNNKELISALSKATGRKVADTTEWLDAFSSVVGNALSEGGSVSIHGFGTFEVRKKEERLSVNPVTKKRFLVPPKLTPVFKPSSLLKLQVKNILPENEREA